MSQTDHIKNTFKHAVIYSGSSLLNKLVGFIMLPMYAHYLRGEGYGIIGMIEVVSSVLAVFIGNGMSVALARYYYIRKTETEKKKLISTSFVTVALLVVIVCIPIMIMRKQVAWFCFGNAGLEDYILYAAPIFMADLISTNALVYIYIKKKSVFFTVFSFIKLIVALSLNILFIAHLKLGVLGYLYGGLVTGFSFTLILTVYVLKRVGLNFCKNDFKDLLTFMAPMIPGYISMFIRLNAIRILIKTYLGLTLLGSYSMLLKFTTLIGILITGPFFRSWGITRLEICEKEDGPATIAKVFTLHMALTIFIGMILALEIPLILKVLTPSEFWLSGNIVIVGVFSNVLMSSFDHMSFGLLYVKNTSKISIIQVVGGILTLMTSIIFIKLLGLFGAVFSSFFVALIMNFHAFYWSQKEYYIPYEWEKIIKIILVAIILFYAIDNISIAKTSIGKWFDKSLTMPLKYFTELFKLESLKIGKLVAYVAGSIQYIIDGILKLVISLLFIPSLLILKIISKSDLKSILNIKKLRLN